MSKWEQFLSLSWLETLIEFTFGLIAKAAEPMLAFGLVFSAANVLSHGELGANGTLDIVWAISQSVAIEASGGVVLNLGLLAVGAKDKVKASLYILLAIFLAATGGIMLFLNLTGWEQSTTGTPMLLLFALRCIVSVGYVYLCRTKHVPFSAKPEVAPVSSGTCSSTRESSPSYARGCIKDCN